MGCEACRQKEPEANLPLLKNPELNPEDREQFLKSFDNYLENFGKYFDSDFNSLLSENILNYITANPLQLKPEFFENVEGFDIDPVEFKNGNVYQGGWNRNGKMEGKGKYYLKKDKIFVEGIWKEGALIYARIFITNEDNFDIYEGEIQDSNFNGKGKLIMANGQEYEGDFVGGEKTGKGKIIFEDGAEYEGQIEKGELKGEGKMIWKNGYEYEGNFEGNKLEGHGILKGPNGEKYEGDFSNNRFHGTGKYTYSNGNTYQGQFSYGLKKGKGIYKCNNKYMYDGFWANDLPSGVGKLSTWDKKGIIKSSWREGKLLERPVYEKGTKDDFKNIDFNNICNDMLLSIKNLSNLEMTESIQTTQYKLGTVPSFLDDE